MNYQKYFISSLILLVVSTIGCSVGPFSSSDSEPKSSSISLSTSGVESNLPSFVSSSNATNSEANSSINSQSSIQDNQTIRFWVALPNVVDINSQEDIVPLLQTEYGKIPVPKNVPIYLLSGEQVDESYIRPRGCTIDIVCDSFENGKFSNIEKIIVNRTIDQKVDTPSFYYAEVHSFGDKLYFTVDTKGQNKGVDGNYLLNMKEWTKSYSHLLAAVEPVNGRVNHISDYYVLEDGNGNTKGVGNWDYGSIITD